MPEPRAVIHLDGGGRAEILIAHTEDGKIVDMVVLPVDTEGMPI